MGADNDAHYAECHIDTLEVGIVDESAYPKIVSRLRVNQSRRSIHHSICLDAFRNSSPGHKLISSKLGKRRAKVSGKSILLENDIGISKNNSSHVKELAILHKKNVFQKNLTVAQKSFSHNESRGVNVTVFTPPILSHTIRRVSMS